MMYLYLSSGDKVLAVFPETTSFYRSIVVKTPKPPANPNANWDVVVRFEDDEDESGITHKNTLHLIHTSLFFKNTSCNNHTCQHTFYQITSYQPTGKAPARRVPGRFVLLRRDVDDLDEDEEDEDDEEELAK